MSFLSSVFAVRVSGSELYGTCFPIGMGMMPMGGRGGFNQGHFNPAFMQGGGGGGQFGPDGPRKRFKMEGSD